MAVRGDCHPLLLLLPARDEEHIDPAVQRADQRAEEVQSQEVVDARPTRLLLRAHEAERNQELESEVRGRKGRR